jgi:hypothetical protein
VMCGTVPDRRVRRLPSLVLSQACSVPSCRFEARRGTGTPRYLQCVASESQTRLSLCFCLFDGIQAMILMDHSGYGSALVQDDYTLELSERGL